jgi:hypothetical protein
MRRLADEHQAGIPDEIEESRENIVLRERAIAVGRSREPLRCLTDSIKRIAILHERDQQCKPYSQ